MFIMTPKYVIENCDKKGVVISASKNAMLRAELESMSSFMDELGLVDIPLRARIIALSRGYTHDTYPRCHCGAPVTWKKARTTDLSNFCSSECSRSRNVLPDAVTVILHDRDAMMRMRIDDRMSIDDMAAAIGCSGPTVEKWLNAHGVPRIRYNESMPLTMSKLRDVEYLRKRHKDDGLTLDQIADEIGSSKSTVSVYMAQHGIACNDPNAYDRPDASMSKPSMEVADFIRDLGFDCNLSVRRILGSREIDIVVESRKLCIEFNGLYSHVHRPELESDAQRKGRGYHLDKTTRCADAGYSLFHIFSDDWAARRDVVKSMIRSKLGVLTKINARKCNVVSVPPRIARDFMDANHLQGSAACSTAYGLEIDGRLVSVMTFGRSRFNRGYDHELVRFATILDHSVVGGFAKILRHFRTNHPGSIISYADKTHSSGNVYAKNGFRHVKDNPPGYYYVDSTYSKRLHRYGFVKKRIAPGDPRPEWMIMLDRGYRRLWDCGTMVFVLD